MLGAGNGLSYGQMIKALKAGDLKALVLVGEDPLKALGDREGTIKAFQNAETVIVFDSFSSECHEYAETVLPLPVSYEKDGSYYNLEGKLQEFKAAVAPGAGVLTLPEAIKSMAQVMGVKTQLKQEDIQKLPAAGFEALPEGDKPDDAGQFMLELGTVYPHLYGGEQLTINTYHLRREFTGGHLEMHPDDIKEIGARAGWKVKVISKHGNLVITVKANPDQVRKTAFMPVHFGGQELASPGCDQATRTPAIRGIPVKIEKT
jgi:formate dehydrogenase alpha subunit